KRLHIIPGYGRRQGIQGARRCQPTQASGPPIRKRRPDAGRAVRAPRHDAAGRDPASELARGGQPDRHGLAGEGEAALPQSRAALRHLRALDREVRAAATQGVAGAEEKARRRAMSKSTFVYVTYIRTTPEKLFEALTDGRITRQYWGHENISDWQPGSTWKHCDAANGNVRILGEVLESKPPHRLLISWAFGPDAGDKAKRSRVAFDIGRVGDMVKL